MLDAVVISDIHLGSANSQAKALVHFLEDVRHGRLRTRRLVLNGDVFDSIDFRRLKKHHWNVLSELRRLSDEVEITWIVGNHDGAADDISHLLGVEVLEDLVVESGGKRVLFLHGHRFDEFISRYPLCTWLADRVYNTLQWIDPSHRFAKFAKQQSKTFLRNAEKIFAGAVRLAEKYGCDAVCCGHTHHAGVREAGAVTYYNSGCWTEKPCHYLTLRAGVVELHAYGAPKPPEPVADSTVVEAPAPAPAMAVA
ncbi:MAG: UDP-2,3-diacylglucosamine diphosphatase [Gemmataceae bacterium]